jgi:hypothetical protein
MVIDILKGNGLSRTAKYPIKTWGFNPCEVLCVDWLAFMKWALVLELRWTRMPAASSDSCNSR